MKKLMIAAAIVCAAVVSQAAQFTWSADYVYDPSGNGLSGVGAVFMADQIAADVLSAQLAAGDFTGWNTYGQDLKKGSGGYEGNYIPTAGYPAIGTEGSHNFYAVILDAETTDGAKNFFVTSPETKALADDSETLVAFGMQYERSMVPGNWTAINNVPEPTSGLLLLLGVAGLALKRKRA